MKKLTYEHLNEAKTKKLNDYSGRHIRSIETFIEQRIKKAKEIPLYVSNYFIRYLFSLDFKSIQEGIKQLHHRPDDVRASDMSYFLHNIVSTQVKKSIIPPLFDYDRSTRKVKVIDSTLYFFLRNIDKKNFLEELELPVTSSIYQP